MDKKHFNSTYGLSKTRTYNIWSHMKARCLRKTHPRFSEWGGRGIKICERWLIFENFLNDMGEAGEYLSIDRIDNNGDYCPENCKWSTTKEQNRNKNNRKILTANGKSLSVSQWCEELNISRSTLNSRIIRGWTDEKIINTPKRETIVSQKKRNSLIKRICICGKIDFLRYESVINNTTSDFCVSCRMKISKSNKKRIK